MLTQNCTFSPGLSSFRLMACSGTPNGYYFAECWTPPIPRHHFDVHDGMGGHHVNANSTSAGKVGGCQIGLGEVISTSAHAYLMPHGTKRATETPSYNYMQGSSLVSKSRRGSHSILYGTFVAPEPSAGPPDISVPPSNITSAATNPCISSLRGTGAGLWTRGRSSALVPQGKITRKAYRWAIFAIWFSSTPFHTFQMLVTVGSCPR